MSLLKNKFERIHDHEQLNQQIQRTSKLSDRRRENHRAEQLDPQHNWRSGNYVTSSAKFKPTTEKQGTVRGQISKRTPRNSERLQEQRALDHGSGAVGGGVEESKRRADVHKREAGAASSDEIEVRKDPARHEKFDEESDAIREGPEAVFQGEEQVAEERYFFASFEPAGEFADRAGTAAD